MPAVEPVGASTSIALPLIVFFVVIPAVAICGIIGAVLLYHKWSAGRQAPRQARTKSAAQSPPYPIPQPSFQPSQTFSAPVSAPPPAGVEAVRCRCGSLTQLFLDEHGQPVSMKCVSPTCGREAPVGPWISALQQD